MRPATEESRCFYAELDRVSLQFGSIAARHSFAEAIPQFEKAVALTGGNEPQSWKRSAAMYAEVGHFSEAAQTARRALEIAARQNEVGLSEELRHRIAYYYF